MTIHDDAQAASRAVYDNEFAKRQAAIDALSLEKATLAGTVQELELDVDELKARIAELEAKAPEPTPEPEPDPTPANPVPQYIYGPTGKHWPSRTPLLKNEGTVWFADCNWASVADAIVKASDSNDPNATVKVRRGSLVGNGAGSTSKPVIQSIGKAIRAFKVLVIPEEGPGSVTFTGSLRVHDVRNVSFVGFDLGEQNGIVATGCTEFSWARSNAKFCNITNSGTAKTKNVEYIECVSTEVGPLTESDRSAFRNADSGTLDGVLIEGCYYAPVQKAQASAAHLDSLQCSGSNRFDNIVIRDTVIFAASNQAIIVTPTTTIVLDHVLVVAGPSVHVRYPRQAGAYVPPPANADAPWPLNGAPATASIKNESVIVGSPKSWKPVYDASSGVVKSVDKDYLDLVAPVPDATRRAYIWK